MKGAHTARRSATQDSRNSYPTNKHYLVHIKQTILYRLCKNRKFSGSFKDASEYKLHQEEVCKHLVRIWAGDDKKRGGGGKNKNSAIKEIRRKGRRETQMKISLDFGAINIRPSSYPTSRDRCLPWPISTPDGRNINYRHMQRFFWTMLYSCRVLFN